MNFGAIIERALKLTRNYPILWKLGLLALFTEGMTSGLMSGPPLPAPEDQSDAKAAMISQDIGRWLSENLSLAIVLGVVLAVALLLLWYLSLRAKAGLIVAVNGLETGHQPSRFLTTYQSGGPYVWRLFGLYLLFGFCLAVVIGLPAAVLFGVLAAISEQAFLVSVLIALPFLLVLAAYVSFITKMSERAIVLGNEKVIAALGTAHRRLFGRFRHSVVAVLVELGLQLLFVLFIMAIIVVAVGVAAALGFLLVKILPSTILAAVIGAAAILSLIGFFLLAGWFAAFIISYWTLVYRAFDEPLSAQTTAK